MTDPIRILLADDHPTLRVGLRISLQQTPDIEVVAEADTGPEALAQSAALLPDVALLDCLLPELDGPAVAAEIRRRGLPVRVLALSAYTADYYVRNMQAAGALGYLTKDEPADVIIAAVRRAMAGETTYSACIAAKLARWAQGVYLAGLTEREMHVLQYVAQGLSNKEIARALGVTERTIEFHMTSVLQKIGGISRVEAALWAKKHDIVD